MQWVQDPIESNVDNLNNVIREATRHFRYKKKAYLKAKIEELGTNSKIKIIRNLYRSISDFKKGYQPTTYIVKDEKVYLFADSYSIVARGMNYVCISPSYWMCMDLMILNTRIYTKQNL